METTQNGRMCRLIDVNCNEKWVRPLHHLFNSYNSWFNTMSESYNKNRILKNSLLLYVRMLFTMWLNLWATRLVLANLGVEDMGVYGV